MPATLPDRAASLARHLLAGDRGASADLLEGELDQAPLDEVVPRTIEPAMVEIGRLWADRVISVADEHLATATLQTVLAGLHARYLSGDRRARTTPPGDEGDPGRVLLACVPGNRHAMGLRLLADTLEHDGWTVRYLGADVPIDALVDMVEGWRPGTVALSISQASQEADAERTIRVLRTEIPETPRILIGGQAVRADPAMVGRVGADGGAAAVGLDGWEG